MKIALAQIDIVYEDIHSNFATVEEFIVQAKQNDTDLIIFPEMTCTGFSMNRQKIAHEEETIYFMKNLSKTYHIVICFGLVVCRNHRYYNRLMIVDGDEELLSYDKIHPFHEEAQYYEKGNHINRCFIKQIPMTAFICYDLRFPEIFQYASKNCDVIIVIASWPKQRDEHWLTLLKARAIENQCYIIGVNRVGRDEKSVYLGHSVIYNSNGDRITSLTCEEENIYCEIERKDIDDSRRGFYTKQDRRDELYVKLYQEK